jgi:prevent-host-death family protein
MLTVGASEAETHLAELLERVAEGEEVLITRHGKAIARLAPPTVADRERVDESSAS